MAKSIFSKQHEGDPNIKRNTFDLSFANSLTMEMGKLYPVFCKEVLPGDTFRIDSAFGLRFMPMAFPVQTKMRANMQFFYVRNRNLWNKWQQFITKTGQPDEFPYVKASKYCHTNTLGDFFGLPTTLNKPDLPIERYPLGGNFGIFVPELPTNQSNDGVSYSFRQKVDVNAKALEVDPLSLDNSIDTTNNIISYGTSDKYIFLWPRTVFENAPILQAGNRVRIGVMLSFNSTFAPSSLRESDVLKAVNDSLVFRIYEYRYDIRTDGLLNPIPQFSVGRCVSLKEAINQTTFRVEIEFTVNTSGFGRLICPVVGIYPNYSNPALVGTLRSIIAHNSTSPNNSVPYTIYTEDFLESNIPLSTQNVFTDRGYETFAFYIQSLNIYSSENVTDNVESFSQYNVSALPFRAYESIYNAFYRDDRNNPYVVNGVSDPNVYLPTKSGGLDDNDYVLHHVNWEQDFLTTAVPSPQQGPAPLVGVTSTGQAVFMDADGNEYKAQFKVGEDGDTVESVDFPDANIPSSARQTAIALATEGISINDFRNVNALQRWLETNMRKGYKYKDQIASHFGVNISYAELDMPEFIGGVSQLAEIAQINQTSASNDTDPLGSYAGQASVVGGNNHTISTYCDEHGFIIGLFYVVPTPTYSQLLPKHFLKFDPMDYFFPEFGHLGYQPVKYDEVCPVQAAASDVPLTDTFGYQRAWYDYLQSVDEVHGDFRTTLQSFILSRVFRTVPSLNPDFLTVSQDQLNEIFTVTEVNGEPIRPILGQLYFDVLAKRKIPRYGVPRLE